MSNWPYPHIVAHRGGGKLAPENTLAAIDMGAQYGHTMIEFDAKLSKDGEIFLLHDDNLERTSNGWGVAGLPTGAAGFVYLPALIGLAIGTVTFAPIGVKVAHKLPPRKLKLAFAIMLTITARQMLWKILHTV